MMSTLTTFQTHCPWRAVCLLSSGSVRPRSIAAGAQGSLAPDALAALVMVPQQRAERETAEACEGMAGARTTAQQDCMVRRPVAHTQLLTPHKNICSMEAACGNAQIPYLNACNSRQIKRTQEPVAKSSEAKACSPEARA